MEKCPVWISGGLWRSLDAGWRGGVVDSDAHVDGVKVPQTCHVLYPHVGSSPPVARLNFSSKNPYFIKIKMEFLRG